MKESSPSPTQDHSRNLKELYMRRVALDSIICSLEKYRQQYLKIPVAALGRARGAPREVQRLAI